MTNGRTNQRHRTRKDLLAAAARLLKEGGGKAPTMEEVAAAAMVSRATAYRYFADVETLLVEAPLDRAVPLPEEVFRGDSSTDAAARVEKAEGALHEAVWENRGQLRLMLAASMERAVKGGGKDGVPLRQNRRKGLIEAALEPVKGKMGRGTYEKLCAALALVFGTEAMIVFEDVLGMEEKEAKKVKRWAMRVMVEGAMREG